MRRAAALAISAASSLEEVQKLEKALKAGDYATIAKAAAGDAPEWQAIDALIRAAEILVRHEAAVLGAVT